MYLISDETDFHQDCPAASTVATCGKLFLTTTVKPVCNDHLYNKIYYLWFIQ